MALTEQKVAIQMLYPGGTPRIHVMQSDTGRAVVCEITDWTIPSGSSAVVWVKKPSGNAVYDAGTIDYDNNTVTINLTNQMIAEKGLAATDVEIDGADGTMVTAFRFWICVHDKTGYGEESTTELSLLQSLIDSAESATEAASAAAEAATSAAEAADLAAETAASSTTAAAEAATAAAAEANAAASSLIAQVNSLWLEIDTDDGGLNVIVYDSDDSDDADDTGGSDEAAETADNSGEDTAVA